MATDNNQKNTRLRKLSGSDFEITEGQPDITGWKVTAADGKRIGEVEDLIFDTESRKVRYIVLDLDDNELDLDDHEVLVPIGLVQLDSNDDEVRLPGVTAAQLSALPEYDESNLDTGSEEKIRTAFGGMGAGALVAGTANDFYTHDHFNEENFYKNRTSKNNDAADTIPVIKEELNIGKQEVETGGIRLRSRIVEQEVSEDISLREETVKVERKAVDRAAGAGDFQEDEIEMKEHKEVPVVGKEARVVEEIKLSRDVDEKNETISDTVRNTEVDIDRNDRNKRLK